VARGAAARRRGLEHIELMRYITQMPKDDTELDRRIYIVLGVACFNLYCAIGVLL
jgi:hypothetical protein